MKKYKRILVGLDNKSTDVNLLEYVSAMIDYLGIQKIFFIHISRRSKFYSNPELHYANLLFPGNKKNRAIMTSKLQQAFKDFHDLDYSIIIKDGNPELEIPRILKEQDIDLLVLGRKPRPGMTHLLRQLADTAKCSVLIVPKRSRNLKNEDLKPINFFSSPRQAINMAYYYKRLGSRKNSLLHSSSTYYSSQLNRHQSLEGHSEHKDQNIVSSSHIIMPEDLIANCAIILAKQENLARKIFDYSLSKGANLIMFGYRGSNQLASFLFGSIAMKLAEISYRFPILIDKKSQMKNDTLEAFISL